MQPQRGRKRSFAAGLILLLLAAAAVVSYLFIYSSVERSVASERPVANVEDRSGNAASSHSAAEATSYSADAAAREDGVEEEVTGLFDIYGSVRGPAGERLDGVEVVARRQFRTAAASVGAEKEQTSGKPLARTVSNADGGFLLKNVPLRTMLLIARSGNLAPAFCVIDRRDLLARPARYGPLTLQLSEGFTIKGRVVDATGAPAADAIVHYELERKSASGDVEWCDFGFAGDAAAATRADGSFIFTNVARPRREIFIIAGSGDGCATAKISAGEWPPAQDVELIITKRVVRDGVVLDTEDRPIVGARIGFGRARAASGPEGAFHLQIDPRDVEWQGRLIVWAAGFASFSEDREIRSAAADSWRIHLGRGVAVTGKVVNDRGEPVEGAIITFEGRAFLPGNQRIADLGLATACARLHSLETVTVKSGETGEFRADALPMESLIVTARLPGLPATSRPMTVTPPLDNLLLQVPAPPAGFGGIEGKVVDRATRRVILNYKLFAITRWGTLSAVTDGDGNFRVDRCPAGRMTLRIAARDGAAFAAVERVFTLEVGEDRRDLLFEVGGEGIIKVVAESKPNANLDNVEAVLLPVEGDGLADAIPAPAKLIHNIFTWEHVPPGLYAVAISNGGVAIASAPRIRVAPGETIESKVKLIKGAMLMVAVRPREDSATLAPYGIRVRDAASNSIIYDQRPGPTRPMAGAGAHVIVPPGEYIVSIDRGDQTLSEQRARVAETDGAVAIFDIEADPPK
ncbi:MAG: carboxypeptidase regulatory-like domain-containing protein [Planctomycetes bacterium]|nr:carboxypeptidase regulatory-like domain-containing protein [Planctomycetota bacterium]